MKACAFDTVIVGTGCAGYNCADTLAALGRNDVALVTEGRLRGTSRNAGSDKQTYYTLSLSAGAPDSVMELAADLFRGGGLDGDLALCQAAGSVQSFMKLVNLGVPFPRDPYGVFAGYRTDHDPRQRGTSAGPWTSKVMTEALEQAVAARGIPVFDGLLAVKLVAQGGRIRGVVCVDTNSGSLASFACRNLVLATGGEAGAYRDSVYPESQSGALGLLADAGVSFANLHHWQYGLASKPFRWNLSGSYQQALPRYVSVDSGGAEREFLADAFDTPEQALLNVFLKGYQWPFDVRKRDGSSRVDLLVLRESQAGRRVFLDFARNPRGLERGAAAIGGECADYLARSRALLDTPIRRLAALNPRAIRVFRNAGIDLRRDRLEIAVCAQHHNGGAGVDCHWESSLQGLFVIGEAAGTFGAYRPGGSALNAGQVGARRCAERIACRAEERRPARGLPAGDVLQEMRELTDGGGLDHRTLRARWQERMSRSAAAVRSLAEMARLKRELGALLPQYSRIVTCRRGDLPGAFRTKAILTAQHALLGAMVFAGRRGGSAGGALVADAPPRAADETEPAARAILVTRNGVSRWREPRPMPRPDTWFETVWADYEQRRQTR